jgi:hypothetical protein
LVTFPPAIPGPAAPSALTVCGLFGLAKRSLDNRGAAMNTIMRPANSPFLPVRDDWLARRTEAIPEPDLPIVDPHHHLWERSGWRHIPGSEAGGIVPE